jgi:hypothetical protein
MNLCYCHESDTVHVILLTGMVYDMLVYIKNSVLEQGAGYW